MLNKYLFRPVFGVLESDTYHLIPSLRLSTVRTNVDDKKKLTTSVFMLTWINFSVGFSWTNRLKVMTVDEDELKFQKYSLKQKWILGYAVFLVAVGAVIGVTHKIPHADVLAMFFYCWAFMLMIAHSVNRADFVIDEMYSDARSMNESLIEYLMEMTNERVISMRKIAELENELKEAKKTKPVRKAAPKKTMSAE